MIVNQFKELHITPFDTINRNKVKKFLITQDLDFDEDVQYTIAILNNEEIIATGSMDEDVLKCIAVSKDYTGLSLTNKIISLLTTEQYNRGFEHIFVYTKPHNHQIFTDLGFYKIMEIPDKVLLLENKRNGITNFTKQISKHKIPGNKIAGLVMNCNPFTNGHLHLIKTAAKENDIVHIFVVSSERSQFSYSDRLKLVKLGTRHLKNTYIHESGKYIISPATFPSYFLKDSEKIVTAHAELDLHIFAEYIAPSLGINTRYIGEELTCKVTAEYNKIMAQILPSYNIDTVEIPRLTSLENTISASYVRKLLAEKKIEQIQKLVPSTTYDYLLEHTSKK